MRSRFGLVVIFSVTLMGGYLFGLNQRRRAAPTIQQPIQTVMIFENEGGVCFQTGTNGQTVGTAAPLSCAPSCYRPDASSVSATVDEARQEIKFQTYFKVTQTSVCVTTDCGGAPRLAVDLGHLREQTYQVYLGDTPLGELAPPVQDEPVCLGIFGLY